MSTISSIDQHVIVLIVALNTAAIATGIMISAWNYPPSISRSLKVFSIGKFMNAVSFALLAGRGSLPLWLTVVVADDLLIAGLYLNYSAIRALQGKSLLLPGLLALIVVVAAGATYGVYGAMDLRIVRLIAGIALVGTLVAIASELLWRYRQPGVAHIAGGWIAMTAMGFALLRVAMIAQDGYTGTAEVADIGAEFPFLAANSVITTIAAVNFILMCNDTFNFELRKLATTDSLTGLGNRRHLIQRGVEELRRSRRFGNSLAVLAIDIDHFKLINDSHGHSAGDQVIRMIAEACAKALREIDFIGRVGGEEFVAVLSGANRETALLISERLRGAVAGLQCSVNTPVPISATVTIGAAVFAGDADFEGLWERADKALYQGKAAGRDCVVVADA